MRKTILFIDDEAGMFNFIPQILKENQFYVRIFTNGDEAADYITDVGEYVAAIIDREIGGSNCLGYIQGEELMELSKTHNPKAKIISFSAYPDKPPIADRVLKKPEKSIVKDLEELVRYINSGII